MAKKEQQPNTKTEEDPQKTILQHTTFNGKLEHFTYTSPATPSPTKRITRSTTLHRSPASTAPPKINKLHAPPASTAPSHSTATTPTKKRKRLSSAYAPPSKYAHLPNHLTDAVGPSLILLFIGVNPGLTTALTGHAYAHPSNLFWKLLDSSGITDRRCLPSETHSLPRLYGLGNTNIVARASRDAAELSRAEMEAGVAVLEDKVRRWRPEAVCVVGKGIWEAVWRVRYGRGMRKGEFRYGWQDEGENMGVVKVEGEAGRDDEWGGARVFVATTTSGLAAGMRPAEKEAVWRPLGEWVRKRRKERGWTVEEEKEDGIMEEAVKEDVKVEGVKTTSTEVVKVETAVEDRIEQIA